MDRSLDSDTLAQGALAREMALVDSAVEMVATGRAVRMQLGGLAFGDALLDHARRAGEQRRVRVTPRWGIGEEGLALAFEPAVEPDEDLSVPPADDQHEARHG
jgi:hypothetical protein